MLETALVEILEKFGALGAIIVLAFLLFKMNVKQQEELTGIFKTFAGWEKNLDRTLKVGDVHTICPYLHDKGCKVDHKYNLHKWD